MYIVIVGDGKVGALLTEYLSGEGHDVVVIDSNPKVVESAVNSYDVMGICGNGASYQVQKEAGVQKARLFIAVTSSDELNILACLTAQRIGARHTIARVRNPEYTRQLTFMREELGLSMTVNPEYEAATEIFRVLRFPSAIKLDTFAKGMLDLAEVNIGEGSILDGTPLYALHDKFKVNVLVCAVLREDNVFIPSGDFILREGDKIHVSGARNELAAFFKLLGIYKHRVKDVIVVGGGKIGYYLAQQLLESGRDVTVIEQDEERCQELSELLPKASIINGDGTDQEVLAEQGIDKCDACVALTGIDEENIIISMYAQSLQVNKVVTKINRISYDMLGSIGLETVISPKSISANKIVRYVRALHNSEGRSMQTLYKFLNNQAEALEFIVTEEAGVTGVPLKDMRLKKNLLIAGIIRQNKIIFPRGNDCLEEGDSVIVVTAGRFMSNLSEILE